MNAFLFLRAVLRPLKSFDRTVRLFLCATVMDGVVYSAWTLFFNFYLLGRGFDRQFLGMANAMPSLGALLLGIPLGMLSDRIGSKRAMLLGVSVYILSMGLEVTVVQPSLILAFAFTGGLGSMLFFLSQAPFMMKVVAAENRALLFSMNFGLVTLSGAVGNLFAGQLPALFGKWLDVAPRSAQAYQAVLLGAVSLGVLTLIPLSLLREPARSPAKEHDQPLPSLWQVLLHPRTLKLALPNLLLGLGAGILMPYFNVFFLDRFALPDAKLGMLFSAASLMTGLGSVIGPRLVGRLGGKIRTVVYTQSASLVFLLFIGFTPWLWFVSLSYLLRSVLMNLTVPLFHAFALEQVDERRQGALNSVLELAWQVGWTVGPYTSGVIQQAYGFSPLFIITAVTYALAIVFTWVFFASSDREEERLVAAAA